ncbi:unnamed protein product [Echinostoma caproni]|uniref:DNA replication ATP-dependent helicase/nuclease n=1 Tax=Echinostoma caproni TaxID=27848 RepID=A0A183AAL8_9TREM|nr:unnamed protein product [Echinostoma caproni]
MRKAAHRRSSLVVRRQADLLEKHKAAVAFDGGPPSETAPEREFRQANASAKLRRGNYDSLNYAPMDQVTVSSPVVRCSSASGGHRGFSRRSEMLVNRALTVSEKSRRPFSEVTASFDTTESLGKRSKLPIEFPEACYRQNSVDSKKKGAEEKTIVPQGLKNLNSEEVGALNEVIDLLENYHTPHKPYAKLTSRKIVTKDKLREKKSPISAVKSSPVPKIVTSPSAIDEFDANPAIDDSFTQFNLSDWSLGDNKDTEVITDLQDTGSTPPPPRPLKTVPVPVNKALRGQITEVDKSRDRVLIKIDVDKMGAVDRVADTPVEVTLLDSWADSDFTVGDTVQVIPGVGSAIQGHRITISDSSNVPESKMGLETHVPCTLVQHPDYLISCTKLVGSLYCTRRSILEQFWPSGESGLEKSFANAEQTNQNNSGFVMLLGSLLHELFQQLIRIENPAASDGKAWIESMLRRADVIIQAYACRIRITELRTALSDKLNAILRWIEVHCRNDRFGIKGKIDFSLLCRAPGSWLSKTQHTSHSTESSTLSLVPMELKTGRPTYSVEHKGQVGNRFRGPSCFRIVGQMSIGVLLYLLMLLDRYGPHCEFLPQKDIQTAPFGWLVYLQDNQLAGSSTSHPGLIEPNASNFRGLMQTRNRIATKLMRVTGMNLDIPPQADKSSTVWTPELPKPIRRLHTCEMCPVQLACSLLSTGGDHCSSKRTSSVGQIESVDQLLSVRRAHLTSQHVSFFFHWSRLNLLELADTDRLENVVRRIVTGGSVHPSGELEPIPGDFVIVSSHDCKHVGITLGTILPPEATNNIPTSTWSDLKGAKNFIVLATDEPLPKWIEYLRLDRYVSSKGTQLNLSNLVSLMEDSDLGSYLRHLIIDRTPPTFASTLSKRIVQDIRTLLKPMNVDQRAAILRVLMADDYVLIQGYPGTGKTQTLTALLQVLVLLGRKTLVVAHTHSAVDNLLGRLVQVVVGCTALAASGGPDSRHAALSRALFDVVVIDEATQLLLPTALGSLFCLRPKPVARGARFVLVGDPHQLPPLVQSSRARQAGLECSLFSHLLHNADKSALGNATLDSVSTKHPGLVTLTLQYRMNRDILFLTNELTYAHVIRAADERVSQSTLADVLNPDELLTKSPWAKRVFSTSVSDAVVFLDTHMLGLNPSDIGIISPHRKQVASIKDLLHSSHHRAMSLGEELQSVEVNTVDQFQGRDKRLILLSLTVCSGTNAAYLSSNQNEQSDGRLSLLDNLPRLTVALTRAKHKLVIVGCPGTCTVCPPSNSSRASDSSRALCKLFKLLRRIGVTEILSTADQAILNI